MKKIILVFLVFCGSIIYSQVPEQWNPVCTTAVATLTAERLAMFANHSGIHVLQSVITGTTLKYFRFKTDGTLDDSITTNGITVDASGKFPNLVGDEENIFAVYQNGSSVIVKKSTDGGDTWNPEASYAFSSGSTVSNGIDAFYNNNGLHIVWSQKEGSIYESYFARWFSNQWWNVTQITDHSLLQSGGFPTITSSNISGTPRIHICINTGTAELMPNNIGQHYARDFNYSIWTTPNLIILPPNAYSRIDRLITTADGYLNCFFVSTVSSDRFKYTKRTINPVGSWSTPVTISADFNILSSIEKLEITKTNNELLHAFWIEGGFNYSNSTNWANDFEIDGGTSQRELASTSNSNDLYVIFSVTGGVSTLRMRQYDAAPLAPQNFQITNSGSPSYHPVLSWNQLNEPDVSIKSNGLRVERSLEVLGQWSAWTEIAAISGESLNYTDDDPKFFNRQKEKKR